MARSNSLAALVAVAATLAVSTAAEARRDKPHRGLDSLNQPVVERSDFVLELPTSYEGLSPSEQGRLSDWFASLGLGYGDHVFVEEANGIGPARQDVARVAADYGILISEGAPITAGEIAQGGVRVIVSRSVATVPGCPHYETRGASATSSNYGCAVNSNLAAMVADPNDLVLGQSGSIRGDATTATKAIRVYREAAPTGTKGLQDTNTRGRNN